MNNITILTALSEKYNAAKGKLRGRDVACRVSTKTRYIFFMKSVATMLMCAWLGIAPIKAQTWQIGSPNAADVIATLSDGTLTISGTGEMENAPPWSSVRTTIRTVIIEHGITNIGSFAFIDCTNLSEITIANSVITIGQSAFEASGLSEVTIPNSVTTIGIWAFAYCGSLMEVTIPSSVTTIGEAAFYLCGELTKIYNHATTPQSIGDNVFPEDISNITLHVPAASLSDYQTAEVWKDFGTITAATISIAPQNGTITAGTVGSATFAVTTANIANGQTGTIQWFSNATGTMTTNATTGISASVSNVSSNAATVTINATTAATHSTSWFRVIIDGVQSQVATLTISPPQFWQIGSPNAENVVATLSDGTLTISGTGEMRNWNSSGQRPPWNRTSINAVIIEHGVTNIGTFAFYDCTNLSETTIANSVTTIGQSAFERCRLSEITIPNSVTTIGIWAFAYCGSLMEVTIPSSVTTIGEAAFYLCGELTKIYNYATTPQSIGDNVFPEDISNITLHVPAASLSDYQTAEVWKDFGTITAIAEGGNCETIIASGDVTSTMTWELCEDGTLTIRGIGEMMNFANSNAQPWADIRASINTVIIEDGVTSIGNSAFRDCTSLTSITIPNNVTNIGERAFSFSGLTSVIIPNNVTSISDGTFSNCENLTSVTIPNSVVTIEQYAFTSSGLTSLTIPYGVTSIGFFAFSNCRSLTTVTISNSVATIDQHAFSYCYNLTSITIPNSVISIGAMAFSDTPITSITIPSSVTHIGINAFLGTSFINVAADNLNFSSVDGVLFNKDKTTLVQYPVPSQETYYTIPNSVTTIGNSAFRGSQNLTSITIPNGVTSIESYAFEGCSGLTSISIPNGVAAISNSTFRGTNLTTIIIPNSVTTIGEYAFEGCRHLVSIIIPEGVTSIGLRAFQNCRNLTSVVIPNSVTTIANFAFIDCTNLTEIINHSVTPQGINDFMFQNVDISKITLHVPAASLSDYQTAEVWKDFGTITAIGESAKTVTVAAQNGALNAGVAGSATFAVTTGNIANDQTGTIQWFSNAAGTTSSNAPAGISASVSNISDNEATVTINATTAATQGTYWFRVTIDGMQSEVATLTVSPPKTVAIATQNGAINAGVAGSATFAVTTANIANGHNGTVQWFSNAAGTYSTNAPAGISASVSNVSNNAATVTVNATTAATQGTRWFRVTVDGVQSEVATLTISSNVLTWQIGSPNAEDVTATLSEGTLTISGTGAMQGWAFSDLIPWFNVRTSFSAVIIEQGVTSIGNGAFYDCTGLTSVTIPNSVTIIGAFAFSDCTGLTSITIPNSVTSIGWYAFSYCTSLTSITIPNGVTYIEESTFEGCTSLTSITIPNSVTSIGEWVFWECSALTEVTIPHSVTSIGDGAFSFCTSLTSITIPHSVTSIGDGAFSFCTSLTSITIPNSVITIGWGAFSYCTGLTTINVAVDNSYYSSINGVLFDKSATILFQYPARKQGTYEIPNSVATIGDAAFSGCIGLTSITIPNSVAIIGGLAFSGCTGLTSITIPNSVTSIGHYAFSGCTGLTTITIPNSVTSIGNWAFEGCTNLTEFINHATTPQAINDIYVFYEVDISQATLRVPATSLSAYEIAEVWKDFGSISAIGGKTVGATLTAAPTLQSVTTSSITVSSVPAPSSGQSVEYAIVQNIPYPERIPASAWQSGTTFSGLKSDALYYVFARAAENSDYYAGEAVVSSHIMTGFVTSSGAPEHVKPLNAWIRDGCLHVEGLSAGEILSIYNASGALVYQRGATGSEAVVTLHAPGVYIVQAGDGAVRVVFE